MGPLFCNMRVPGICTPRNKTLVNAAARGLVALAAIVLLIAFVYRRRCDCGGRDNNGGRGNKLMKVVLMSMLIDEDVKNLCNGGGNIDGDMYYRLYYGAAGSSAIGCDVEGGAHVNAHQ
jgi:hypothetical protein